jgi:DNA-binding NarL/FixJ family response regulator
MIKRHVNIAIIEPSHIVFEGLNTFLLKNIENSHIERIDNLADLLQTGTRKKIDIVIVNPNLCQQNGKQLQTLKNELANSKWIGLVYAYFDPQLLSNFDANIYINDSPNSITDQIENLIRSDENSDTSLQQESLSTREIDVLKLLAAGNANKEIADKLNISTYTVISHRKNITIKTGIKSVSGLTIFAVINGLVSLSELSD